MTELHGGTAREAAGKNALNVLVTGGSGASGIAAAQALRAAGHLVLTVGSDRDRIIAAASEAGDGVTPLVCDLASAEAVRELHSALAAEGVRVDGVVHLVGGWRGAKGIPDQSDEDWAFLERGSVTTLRNVSRTFFEDLASSPRGRFAMVSSTVVEKPTAAVASYAAAKAAAEAWTMAMADGFRRAAEAGEGDAAAVVLVVKALVDDELRRNHPERSFPGATDVADLAAAVVRLFDQPAAAVNGTRQRLAP